jgi:hypothetical protein
VRVFHDVILLLIALVTAAGPVVLAIIAQGRKTRTKVEGVRLMVNHTAAKMAGDLAAAVALQHLQYDLIQELKRALTTERATNVAQTPPPEQ